MSWLTALGNGVSPTGSATTAVAPIGSTGEIPLEGDGTESGSSSRARGSKTTQPYGHDNVRYLSLLNGRGSNPESTALTQVKQFSLGGLIGSFMTALRDFLASVASLFGSSDAPVSQPSSKEPPRKAPKDPKSESPPELSSPAVAFRRTQLPETMIPTSAAEFMSAMGDTYNIRTYFLVQLANSGFHELRLGRSINSKNSLLPGETVLERGFAQLKADQAGRPDAAGVAVGLRPLQGGSSKTETFLKKILPVGIRIEVVRGSADTR